MKLATLQCANVRAWFSAYVGGRLGLTEWALVEVHLAQCAECQRELRRLRESGKPRRPGASVDMVRARTSHATMAASDRFRTHARRLTGLARVLATPLLATLILRIGTGFMSVVLVATLWGLRGPDRPTQSAQPATSAQTTAVPASRQADESVSPPGQDVPIQSGSVPIRRPNIRRATGSPAPPRPQTEIPMPVRIPVLGSPELLRQILREIGYVEGLNLAIEWRDAEGKTERFGDLAAELVRLKVDVIVAGIPAATFAAKRSTESIPIVMVNTPDPVQLGLVVSLGRPGGNVTGTTTLSADVSIKQLELLKEAVPRAVRIAVLWNPSNPWHPIALKGAEAAARSLAVQLQLVAARDPDELNAAFAAMTRERAGAVLVLADPMTFYYRTRLADLAAKRRLPAMYSGSRGYVEAGGLMHYWANQADLYRRVGSHVDRILKGAKPGDLPIEQPTKFELVINLKTAKALGLAISQSLLQRADQVIE